MTKINIVRLFLALTCALIITACSGQNPTTVAPTNTNNSDVSASASNGGDLQLDVANADQKNDALILNIYEALVKENNGKITGVLAESYSISDDGLDYIFNLRPGVTFHTGESLNADVVISNFNRWFDQKDPNRGSGAFQTWESSFGGFKGEVTEANTPKSTFDGVEKVDDLTVLIHLNTGDVDFLKKISDPAFSIISPSVLKSATGDGGTGPYKFNTFIDSGKIKLDPYESYWNSTSIPSEPMEISIN